MAYRSDFKYTPDPSSSPCFDKTECQHKQKTMGECRNYCFDYNEYEKIMDLANAEQNSHRIRSQYRCDTLQKQEKRARGC